MVNVRKQDGNNRIKVSALKTSGAVSAYHTTDIIAQGLAKDWAVKMDGLVDNTDYSSKYYAVQAKTDREISDVNAQIAVTQAQIAKAQADRASDVVNQALAPATADRLGGIKVGSNLFISQDGVLNTDAYQLNVYEKGQVDTFLAAKLDSSSLPSNVSSFTNDAQYTAKSYVDNLHNQSVLKTQIATASTPGIVKPDGTTINIDENGKLSAVSRNVGEIVTSSIPLSDAGLHLLDGSLLDGNGSYGEFAEYVKGLYEETKAYNSSAFTVVGTPQVSNDGILNKNVYSGNEGLGNYLTANIGTVSTSSVIKVTCVFTIHKIQPAGISGGLYSLRGTGGGFLVPLISNNTSNLSIYGLSESLVHWYTLNLNEEYTFITERSFTSVTLKLYNSSGVLVKSVTKNAPVQNATWWEDILLYLSQTDATQQPNISCSYDLKKFSVEVDDVEIFSGAKPDKYFVSESDWQTSIVDHGACGKFVYDKTNNTVRLPKITGIMEGTLNLSDLGSLVEAGLPNISGYIAGIRCDSTGGADSALYSSSPNSYTGHTGGNGYSGLSFNASRCNAVYGNSSTVQPQTIKVLCYIVVSNSVKTEIQVNIDNIAADLNTKADADLSNISASQSAKTEIVGWGIPDYTSMVTITSPHTALADGIIMANYDGGNNPTINSNSIPVSGNDSGNEGPFVLYVRKNDVITLTGHNFRFVPFGY